MNLQHLGVFLGENQPLLTAAELILCLLLLLIVGTLGRVSAAAVHFVKQLLLHLMLLAENVHHTGGYMGNCGADPVPQRMAGSYMARMFSVGVSF